jgi:hypothetical protein
MVMRVGMAVCMGMIVVMRVRVRHLEKSPCFGGSIAGVIALAEANTITAPFCEHCHELRKNDLPGRFAAAPRELID